jgi:hypothetical protein
MRSASIHQRTLRGSPVISDNRKHTRKFTSKALSATAVGEQELASATHGKHPMHTPNSQKPAVTALALPRVASL